MFMAGLGADFEFDLKRVIALSTLRQLGLLIITLSISFPFSSTHMQTKCYFENIQWLKQILVLKAIVPLKQYKDI